MTEIRKHGPTPVYGYPMPTDALNRIKHSEDTMAVPITDPPPAVLRGRYEAGATIRALVTETGRSYGWVHSHLRAAGTPLRGRGGYHPRRTPTRHPT
jgi:hypothetical protein